MSIFTGENPQDFLLNPYVTIEKMKNLINVDYSCFQFMQDKITFRCASEGLIWNKN